MVSQQKINTIGHKYKEVTMSNNKKLTSVELFAKTLAEQGLLPTRDYKNLLAYQQAQKNHIEEIVNAWTDGDSRIPEEASRKEAEHYYAETFGGNK